MLRTIIQRGTFAALKPAVAIGGARSFSETGLHLPNLKNDAIKAFGEELDAMGPEEMKKEFPNLTKEQIINKYIVEPYDDQTPSIKISIETAKEFCNTLKMPELIEGASAAAAAGKAQNAAMLSGDRSKFPTLDEVDAVARTQFDIAEKTYALSSAGVPPGFMDFKKAFFDMGSSLPKEKESVDWAYWRAALPEISYWDEIEKISTEASNKILEDGSQIPIDHLLEDLKALEAKEADAAKDLKDLKAYIETGLSQLAALDEFEAKVATMTVDDLMEKFPELKAEVDAKVHAEQWF